MRSSPFLPLLLMMTATLAACAHNTDSVAKLNEIPFGGAVQANLAAMVANPADLVRGRGQVAVDGASAVLPLDRLSTDRQKPLLSSGHSATGAGGAGG
jgi:type IV pilus biogenesis protein CpaD/CtpE